MMHLPPPDDEEDDRDIRLQQEAAERVQFIERAYAGADWRTRRGLLAEYVTLVNGSALLGDLGKALAFMEKGKKHPLLHDDCPPLYLEDPWRPFVEGYAAALLEWGVEDRFAKQQDLAGKIAKVLAEVGYYRPMWGIEPRSRLSVSTIIKLRNRCKQGSQPAKSHFEACLERLRWFYRDTTGALDLTKEALEEFRDCLRTCGVDGSRQ